MAKKQCELCQKNVSSDMRIGVYLCKECMDYYSKAVLGDEQAGLYLATSSNFPNATDSAKSRIIKAFEKKYERNEEIRRKNEEIRLAEQQRQDFANSFGEFYEYDVVTVVNEGHGQVDKPKLLAILNERARLGWKLHSIYSNELGKKAVSLMGLGINSTACEDVLIFERRIKNF